MGRGIWCLMAGLADEMAPTATHLADTPLGKTYQDPLVLEMCCKPTHSVRSASAPSCLSVGSCLSGRCRADLRIWSRSTSSCRPVAALRGEHRHHSRQAAQYPQIGAPVGNMRRRRCRGTCPYVISLMGCSATGSASGCYPEGWWFESTRPSHWREDAAV